MIGFVERERELADHGAGKGREFVGGKVEARRGILRGSYVRTRELQKKQCQQIVDR